jgi:hypothetical protein
MVSAHPEEEGDADEPHVHVKFRSGENQTHPIVGGGLKRA